MSIRARSGTTVLLALALLICPRALQAQDGHGQVPGGVPLQNQVSAAESGLGRRPPPIEITAQVGFDHRSRGTMPGTWAPVSLWISNHTSKELFGTVKLNTVTSAGEPGGSKVSRPVHLRPGKRRLIRTTVFVEPADTRVEIAVTTATGESASITEALLASPRFARTLVVIGEANDVQTSVSPSYPHDEMILGGREGTADVHPIIGQPVTEREPRSENNRNRWHVLQPQVETLPDRWIGYAGIWAVVLTDPAAVDAMSDAQWEALVAHVRSGGHLVIELASMPAIVRASGSARLLAVMPARGSAPVKVTRDSLVSHFGGPRDLEGDMSVFPLVIRPEAEARARCTPEVLSVGDSVVTVMFPMGLGRVTALGFCLVDPRFSGNESALQSVLRQVFEVGPGKSVDYARQTSPGTFAREVDHELKSEELAQIPSHRVLLMFLIAYCLLIGPVNRLVFTSAGRPLGAWLVLPLIVMGFIGIALTKLSIKRPEVPLLREITVLQLRNGDEDALARSYLSLYTPDRATYRLEFPNRGGTVHYLVHSEHRGLDRETLAFADGVKNDELDLKTAQPADVDAARPFRLAAITLAPRSSANLEAVQRVPLTGTLEVHRPAQGPTTVVNKLGIALEGGVCISSTGSIQALPALRPGDTYVVGTAARLRGFNELLKRTGRDRKVIESIVNQLKQTREHPALIAWSSTSLTRLKCRAGEAGAPQTSALTFFLVHPPKGQ